MSNFQGAILFHGVGSGKTLTAVVYSHYYLSIYPKNRVVVITPPALIYNFINGMQQYGLNIQDNRYEFTTYVKFCNSYNKFTDENTLLIIDEAHNFRTHIIATETFDKNGKMTVDAFGYPIYNITSNKRGHAILQACKRCHKSLLLTGTPFINKLYDIENLISMVDKKQPLDQNNFAHIVINKTYISDYFGYRLSYFETSKGSEFFPSVNRFYIPIIMQPEHLKKYSSIEKGNSTDLDIDEDIQAINIFGGKDALKLKAFHNATRQYSEFLGGYKVKYVIDTIKKSKGKAIIYTTFLNSSLKIYVNELTKENITYSIISGSVSQKQKETARTDYNTGKSRVLLITKAGTEGVDTIATENIFICEPLWNEALTEQAIARAVRYKSHYHLPKNQQYVNVYRVVLCKSDNDKKLIDMVDKQTKTLNYTALITKLKKLNKDTKELLKLQSFQNTDLSKGEIKSLSKSDQYYYYKSKDTSRYAVDEALTTIFKNMPSIETYLTIMSLAKQAQIEAFMTAFKEDTPKIEKQINKKLQKGEDIKNIITLQKNELTKEKQKIRQELTNKKSDVNKLLVKVDELHKKQKSKLIKVKLFQEFFTPLTIIKKMLETSIKLKGLNDLVCLEPTAGSGNIVKEIIKKPNVKIIDMVEIAPINREILKELVKVAPTIFKLYDEGDFLKFLTPTRYDLIVMNPPFHLRKSYLSYLDRDYYDMDFVMKAFTLLKNGGEIIALVRMENKNKTNFLKWLDSKNATIIDLKDVKWQQSKEKGKKSKIDKINLSIINIIRHEEDIKDNIIIERTDAQDKQIKFKNYML